MNHEIYNINLLKLLVELIETEQDIISFSRVAEIISKRNKVKLNSHDVTRWLRHIEYLEPAECGQQPTDLGESTGFFVTFEKRYGGKKRMRTALTIAGMMFLSENYISILSFKEKK